MVLHNKNIGMVIYANPDHYPPLISAVELLGKEYDLIIICRNQDRPQLSYPSNVRLYRLGKLKTTREKEAQGLVMKILEYLSFILRTVFYLRYFGCRLIYSYDMHGFVAGFLAAHFGRRLSLIYHNLDLGESDKLERLRYVVKQLELKFAPFADRVVFPDADRIELFRRQTKLTKLVDIVMNASLRKEQLPPNKLKELLQKNGYAPDTRVVLYQGAINAEHAIPEVIASMLFWPKDTVLALSGFVSEDFKKQINKQATALNIMERIIILPFMPYSELFSYTVGAYLGLALFKSKDFNQIFVVGASNKIFEYLSLGIPILTNDSPHFHKVLDSSVAYFTRPDSVEEIAAQINLAFSDREGYLKKRQAARELHLKQFNYQVQFSPIIEYIREKLKV